MRKKKNETRTHANRKNALHYAHSHGNKAATAIARAKAEQKWQEYVLQLHYAEVAEMTEQKELTY